jgi:hypothetical protein
LKALGEIFPGFQDDLIRAGADPVRVAQDVRLERPDIGVLPQRDFGQSILCASRPLIEHVLRQRTEALPSIGIAGWLQLEWPAALRRNGHARAASDRTEAPVPRGGRIAPPGGDRKRRSAEAKHFSAQGSPAASARRSVISEQSETRHTCHSRRPRSGPNSISRSKRPPAAESETTIFEFESKTQSADTARRPDLQTRPKETETMISIDTFQGPHFHFNRASALLRRCQQLIVLQQSRHKATLHNLIDQVINAGLIALIGCSIAAALVVGAPMPAGGTQAAMPTAERRSLLDQHIIPASPYEPRMQRLVGTVNAPVGQGWG